VRVGGGAVRVADQYARLDRALADERSEHRLLVREVVVEGPRSEPLGSGLVRSTEDGLQPPWSHWVRRVSMDL
jgi:hypothetical protein